MSILPTVLLGLAGFGVCAATVPLVLKGKLRPLCQRRMFHHASVVEVPRMGGICLLSAFLAVAALASQFVPSAAYDMSIAWAIVLSATAMFAIGFLDDLRPIDARLKLFVQVAIAAAVYYGGVKIELFKNPFTNVEYELGHWAIVATVLWIVALTNLINIIDGIDGLAAGISLMLMCLLIYAGYGSASFYYLLTVGLGGALLAFLHFNFPPARIYMGDGGAYLLGFLIAVLTVVQSQKGSVAAALIAPLFALALPILDVALTIGRRWFRGLPIFRPDQRHIHHRLVKLGFSGRRTLLTLYAVSLVCLTMAFVVLWSHGRLVPILFGAMFLILFFTLISFGIFGDLLAVGGSLGTSLRLRRETRYALLLSQWLDLEAERAHSLESLLSSFLFLADRMGFSQVRLLLAGEELTWASSSSADGGETKTDQHARYSIDLGNMLALELSAPFIMGSSHTFAHLAELAAEAWLKAVTRWQLVSGQTPLINPGAVTIGRGELFRRATRPLHSAPLAATANENTAGT